MLPSQFSDWFARRGWSARPHQLALVDHAARGDSVLLVAPTGGGKTLAGFLPTLIDLAGRPKRARKSALHTLYISPLKALAVDVARNLDTPIAEMELPVTVETRTGDTSVARRQRQRHTPPDILLTTPEQLSLLLAHPRAQQMFESLKTVVLDELHARRAGMDTTFVCTDFAHALRGGAWTAAQAGQAFDSWRGQARAPARR